MQGTFTLFAVAICVAVPAMATFGPPQEVPFNPSFIAASTEEFKLLQLGAIASKSYVIFTEAAAFAPQEFLEFRLGDLNGPTIPFTDNVLAGDMPFGIRKTCYMPKGYKAISFTPSDTADYTKNNTASIYYYRMSTKYNGKIIQDDLCAEEYEVSSDGDEVYGCLRYETSATGCDMFLDTVGTTVYDVMSWVLCNGIPIGEQSNDYCAVGDTVISRAMFFYKMQGFRDILLSLVEFENQ